MSKLNGNTTTNYKTSNGEIFADVHVGWASKGGDGVTYHAVYCCGWFIGLAKDESELEQLLMRL